MRTEKHPIHKIKLNGTNPRIIKDHKFKQLVKSIKSFPEMLELRPIVVNEKMVILGGNMRYRACLEAGLKEIPTVTAKGLTLEQQLEFIIKDNVGFGEWEWDILANEWEQADLSRWGLDLPIGFNFEEQEPVSLTDKFLVPPLSVLDTRQGYWQERKKNWKARIDDNGETRAQLLSKGAVTIFKPGAGTSGVSILDPVLAEIANHWFGVKGGNTFDPFAGDSVFGYVSSYLGNKFTGIEIRQEQSDANNERIKEFKESKYYCDDGQNVKKYVKPNTQDLLFSCPPYFDLEVYSDLPNDASNQKEYSDFLQILERAFTDSIKALKNNRFAVIVVGDIRDKQGLYRRFNDDVKDIFTRKNDMHLYNELILVEPVGNLRLRVGKQMKNRKVGKCHQNVLVFYKGDPKEISKEFDIIEVSMDNYGSEDA